MNPIQSLLAATDFSSDARHAIERAALLAAEHRSALTLLHVVSGPALASLRDLFESPAHAEGRIASGAEQQLARLAADLGAAGPLAVSTRVRVGAVLPEILAAAEDVDLVVMGVRGQNPLRDAILGTTAERLLGKCTRPALVVKRAARSGYRRVLVPVDFSSCAERALETALRIAPQAHIHACHACDLPFEGKLWLAGVDEERINLYRDRERQRALAALRDMTARVAGPGPRHPFVSVEAGDPVGVILRKTAELDADLIVIGKQGRSAVSELLLGSVTRHVLADSDRDVLVVHPGGAG